MSGVEVESSCGDGEQPLDTLKEPKLEVAATEQAADAVAVENNADEDEGEENEDAGCTFTELALWLFRRVGAAAVVKSAFASIVVALVLVVVVVVAVVARCFEKIAGVRSALRMCGEMKWPSPLTKRL